MWCVVRRQCASSEDLLALLEAVIPGVVLLVVLDRAGVDRDAFACGGEHVARGFEVVELLFTLVHDAVVFVDDATEFIHGVRVRTRVERIVDFKVPVEYLVGADIGVHAPIAVLCGAGSGTRVGFGGFFERLRGFDVVDIDAGGDLADESGVADTGGAIGDSGVNAALLHRTGRGVDTHVLDVHLVVDALCRLL